MLVRPFSRDQAAARRVVREGLVGRFGFIDASKNSDLEDSEASCPFCARAGFEPSGADEIDVHLRLGLADV